jgi:hypothetical protein
MEKMSASEEALRQQFRDRKYMTRADQRKWISKKGKINLTGEQIAVLKEFVTCNNTIGVAAAVANAEKDFPLRISTIASRTGFNEQRIHRYIARLVALKLMTVTSSVGKISLYRIHLEPMLDWKKEKPQETPAVIAKRKNAAKAREARAQKREAKDDDDLATALREGMEAAGSKIADRRLDVAEANLARTQEQLLDLQQNMALAERIHAQAQSKPKKAKAVQKAPTPAPAKTPPVDEGPVIEPWEPYPGSFGEPYPTVRREPEVKINIGYVSASDDAELEPEESEIVE